MMRSKFAGLMTNERAKLNAAHHAGLQDPALLHPFDEVGKQRGIERLDAYSDMST